MSEIWRAKLVELALFSWISTLQIEIIDLDQVSLLLLGQRKRNSLCQPREIVNSGVRFGIMSTYPQSFENFFQYEMAGKKTPVKVFLLVHGFTHGQIARRGIQPGLNELGLFHGTCMIFVS